MKSKKAVVLLTVVALKKRILHHKPITQNHKKTQAGSEKSVKTLKKNKPQKPKQ